MIDEFSAIKLLCTEIRMQARLGLEIGAGQWGMHHLQVRIREFLMTLEKHVRWDGRAKHRLTQVFLMLFRGFAHIPCRLVAI